MQRPLLDAQQRMPRQCLHFELTFLRRLNGEELPDSGITLRRAAVESPIFFFIKKKGPCIWIYYFKNIGTTPPQQRFSREILSQIKDKNLRSTGDLKFIEKRDSLTQNAA